MAYHIRWKYIVTRNSLYWGTLNKKAKFSTDNISQQDLHASKEIIYINSLRPSDAYMRQ